MSTSDAALRREHFHQLEALHRLRCDAVQGFLLARPTPADGLPAVAPPALLRSVAPEPAPALQAG